VEARNLYRGLGLTLQLGLSGLPMVVGVNMIDEARRQGMVPDTRVLTQHLGVPVIGLSARTGEGIPELQQALYEVIKHPEETRLPHMSCPPLIEKAFAELADTINRAEIDTRLDHTFLAMRLLEEDSPQLWLQNDQMAAIARQLRQRLEQTLKTSIPVACANCRFNAARGLAMEAMHRQPVPEDRLSKALDRIFLHRWFGLPIFFLLMLLLFQGVYGLAAPLQELLAFVFNQVGSWLAGCRVFFLRASGRAWL
jgi:ferrous iron transport protein B